MSKVILAIAGEIASGKGEVASYVTKKYKANMHRYSTMLRDLLKRLYLDENRENIVAFSTFIRQKWGEDIMSKVIYEDVRKDMVDVVILDGVRRVEDIKYVKQLPNFYLVYVNTDMKIRFERIIKRGENVDDNSKTFKEFKKDHKRETELQIRGLKTKADFVIDNNGSKQDLYIQLDKIIADCTK